MMFSRVLGSGKPIIIIHGLFGMSDNWNTIAKKLSPFFEVHLIDLRNHGRSFHSDHFNYDHLTEDLSKYIIHNSLDDPILLGHSLGGKIAMNYCFLNKNIVKQLIVVDIAPKIYSVKSHAELLENLLSLELLKYKSRSELDQDLSLKIADDSTRLFLMKNLYRDEEKNFAWRFNIKVLKDEIYAIQNADFIDGVIDTPSLFISGENSNYINNQDFSLIRKHFSKVIFKEIERAGHWVHAENQEMFVKSVTDFLQIND